MSKQALAKQKRTPVPEANRQFRWQPAYPMKRQAITDRKTNRGESIIKIADKAT
ncbi:MAG: hypothetical protein Q7R66_07210 [Undibacterium sp.]|uniref:hypothetical protein n=1 Tax=Undibacterium sp. TaxID=1914977 RepID=UPI00271F11F7|nr:hypothetical protein [Undibacterium sp.]MDO8651959.1 hypothetical protein [Undibacterium sp.]